MKQLYLIRHAKSSWLDSELTDFERPLNQRGRSNAPMMGEILQKKGFKPDVIISSPANRALTTARMMAEQLRYPLHEIQVKELIYEAHMQALLDFIRTLNNKFEKVMLVGHNPGFTLLAEYLTGTEVKNLPTASIFAIEFPIKLWKEVDEKKGKRILYEYPKKYS